jgi:mannitol-1-phosphate/altronate dehydrogenase
MSKGLISEQILKTIQQTIKDKAIRDFIIELIYEEANHIEHWRFKNSYNNLIEKYSEIWSPEK